VDWVMVLVGLGAEVGLGFRPQGSEGRELRWVRSGSAAAKEVKLWVPRRWAAASCMGVRLRGQWQSQT